MKVSFIIGQLSNGGAERVVSILANAFSKTCEVEIVTLISQEKEYYIAPEVKVVHINPHTNNKILRVLRRCKGLEKYLKQSRPDVLVSFTTEINIYSIFANIKLRIPLIISERNDPFNDPPSKFKRTLRNNVYYKADGYVFQTPDAQSYFSKIISKVQTVIPNPVKQDLPCAISVPKTKKIVTVSRLYEQKNIPLLIDAFAEISKNHTDYTLEIYGDGPLKEQLLERINSKGLNKKVLLKGFCKDVHECISNAEIFVLVSNYEGMSNAMIEAMAMGLPVICTDCPIGGAKMMIDNNNNGILIPVNDKSKLISGIEELISNKPLRDKLSNNAYSIRVSLSPEQIVDQWKKFIDIVLKSE